MNKNKEKKKEKKEEKKERKIIIKLLLVPCNLSDGDLIATSRCDITADITVGSLIVAENIMVYFTTPLNLKVLNNISIAPLGLIEGSIIF